MLKTIASLLILSEMYSNVAFSTTSRNCCIKTNDVHVVKPNFRPHWLSGGMVRPLMLLRNGVFTWLPGFGCLHTLLAFLVFSGSSFSGSLAGSSSSFQPLSLGLFPLLWTFSPLATSFNLIALIPLISGNSPIFTCTSDPSPELQIHIFSLINLASWMSDISYLTQVA